MSGSKILALVAMGFGVLTLFAGGRVLFGPGAARVAAGNFVPFVVWFNFLAGGFYVVAGAGILRRARWARTLAWGIATATALVAVGFAVWVLRGAEYEMRTVGALALRTGVWMVIATLLGRSA